MNEKAVWEVDGTTTRLRILVKPKSGKFSIAIEGNDILIHVKSPPEKGKANKEIIKGLAKILGLSSSAIRLISGQTTTEKILEIDAPFAQVQQKLTKH
ncbi:MAG: DUF167 domain-containing protein [Methanobacteriota archaeon]|nr:MAG: DUF167 domain-containing protein [Euryarchaeota archaeon]